MVINALHVIITRNNTTKPVLRPVLSFTAPVAHFRDMEIIDALLVGIAAGLIVQLLVYRDEGT